MAPLSQLGLMSRHTEEEAWEGYYEHRRAYTEAKAWSSYGDGGAAVASAGRGVGAFELPSKPPKTPRSVQGDEQTTNKLRTNYEQVTQSHVNILIRVSRVAVAQITHVPNHVDDPPPLPWPSPYCRAFATLA